MSSGPNKIERYGGVAQALHWLVAIMVFCVFALALTLDNAPRATKAWWVNLHVVVGLLMFATVILRLFWRMGHKPPPPPEGTSDLLRIAGAAAHHLMYLLLVVGPVIGLVAYIWHARVFDFGLFTVNPGVPNTKSVYEPAEEIHKFMMFSLMGLVALHFLASLWHHFVKRDGLLWRMLPGGR